MHSFRAWSLNRAPDVFDRGDLMKHRVLVIIAGEDGWRVRLDGVDVVSFFGPYAQEWAVREGEELAQLLDARSSYVAEHSGVIDAQLTDPESARCFS
jgi:hypothetical protein